MLAKLIVVVISQYIIQCYMSNLSHIAGEKVSILPPFLPPKMMNNLNL